MAVSKQDREAFFAQALPYAEEAHDRTGIPVSVILAQWGLESAYGTSWIARNGLNFAGIKAGSSEGNQDGTIQSPDGSGPYGAYASWDRFVHHWARIIEAVPAYADLRQTVAAGGSPDDILRALALSPWAESHYVRNSIPGQGLLDVIEANDLRRYDYGEDWSGGGFAVRPDGSGYRVQVPANLSGIAWPAVLIMVGAVGMASFLGGGQKK